MKLKVLVKNKDVKWLSIESDENDTKGYFLYYHIDDNNAYDTWHKSLDDAFEAAKQQYGVKKENWQELE